VLVHGETGTGKELVAAHLHAASRRAERAFVAVNCAAIPEALIETELFGHAKGAFTGATSARRGRFLSADGGTLFLDEIGELSPAAQAKLLRVLESGEVQPVGADDPLAVDVRIIAASHRDLLREVGAGRFREDLFYRLDVLALDIPPLRVRGDDIAVLAEHFRAVAVARLGRPIDAITAAAQAALRAYGWPGNVRQLRNEIERAVLLAEGDAIDTGDLRLRGIADAAAPTLAEEHARLDKASWELVQRAIAQGGSVDAAARLLNISPAELEALLARDPASVVLVAREPSGTWTQIELAERQLLEAALRDCGGNVRDAGRALGVSRATMYRKVEKYDLK
jgi:DNA-binding NtrC family response regulator